VTTGKFFVGFSSFNGIIGEGFGGQYDSIESISYNNNRFTILLELKEKKVKCLNIYIIDCLVVIHEWRRRTGSWF
jgi:hypothetical protein